MLTDPLLGLAKVRVASSNLVVRSRRIPQQMLGYSPFQAGRERVEEVERLAFVSVR
jgi:hypothetical protein